MLTQIMILSRKISCARYLSPLVLDCWTKWTPRQAVSLETVRTGAGVADSAQHVDSWTHKTSQRAVLMSCHGHDLC